MAIKYHISPATGRPNICKAQHSCPVGSDNEHFTSKDAARTAYENSQGGSFVESPLKKTEKAIAWPPNRTEWPDPGDGTEVSPSNIEGWYEGTNPSDEVYYFAQEEFGPQVLEVSPGNFHVFDSDHEEIFRDFATPEEAMTSASEIKVGPVSPSSIEMGTEPPEGEKVDLDDDFSSIRCDDCDNILSRCTCDGCEYCGVYDGDDHYEECPEYRPVTKAYSWD